METIYRFLKNFAITVISLINLDSSKLDVIVNQNKQIIERLDKNMSALSNLQDSINRLSTAVDNAVTVLNTPHPSESAIQAAADLVNAQAARLESASTVTVTSTATGGVV